MQKFIEVCDTWYDISVELKYAIMWYSYLLGVDYL